MTILSSLWSIATSRLGLIVIIAIGLFTWHKLDKSSAVRGAVAEYVAGVELAAERAEKEALKRRLEKAVRARHQFEKAKAAADLRADQAIQELEDYESQVGADCVVDGHLLERLRNN